jgi:hypothetical protein
MRRLDFSVKIQAGILAESGQSRSDKQRQSMRMHKNSKPQLAVWWLVDAITDLLIYVAGSSANNQVRVRPDRKQS